MAVSVHRKLDRLVTYRLTKVYLQNKDKRNLTVGYVVFEILRLILTFCDLILIKRSFYSIPVNLRSLEKLDTIKIILKRSGFNLRIKDSQFSSEE